jgi:hypothetical protein
MATIQRKKHWSARLLGGLAVLLSVAVASADEFGRQRLRATIDVSEVFTPNQRGDVDRGDHVRYPCEAVLPWRRRLMRQALAPDWGFAGAVAP